MKRRTLPTLKFTPRTEQADAVQLATSLIESRPEEWHLFVSPTGTGKSIAELLLLRSIPNSILVTPRIEIIRDMLAKANLHYESVNDIVNVGSAFGLYTPIRLRNLLAGGNLPFNPSLIILDECHHAEAESWDDIQMYLNGIPVVGFTATPYRGTPKGTEAFRKRWGTINTVITLADAVAKGYCTLPTAVMWPMVDDDVIDLVNGEIKISAADKLIQSRICALIHRCLPFFHKRSRLWDRPTMFSFPSTASARKFADEANAAGLPCNLIVQDSTRGQREQAFRQVVEQTRALVQIDVVSEGVDLPIRRLIDVKPTMSPVRWLQQVGRIMRPSDTPPEYICLCRNLERHGYLMEGLYPPEVMKTAQEAFCDADGIPIVSKRSGARAIGLEGLGKFTTTPIHFLNGCTGFLYNLVHNNGFRRSDIVILVNPVSHEPLKAVRESIPNGKDDNGFPRYDWGRWRLVESIPELKGCQSAKSRPLTPNQRMWWLGQGKYNGRGAEAFGLNPHKEVNERSFQVLPLLKDLGLRL